MKVSSVSNIASKGLQDFGGWTETGLAVAKSFYSFKSRHIVPLFLRKITTNIMMAVSKFWLLILWCDMSIDNINIFTLLAHKLLMKFSCIFIFYYQNEVLAYWDHTSKVRWN